MELVDSLRAHHGGDNSFFALMYFADTHSPYGNTVPGREFEDKAEGFRTDLQAVDRMLGRVLDPLDQLEIDGGVQLFVLGDHGESLGERGRWWHNTTVHVEQAQIAVSWSGPAIRPAVTDRVVSLPDITATIYETHGIAATMPLSGVSLTRERADHEPVAVTALIDREYAITRGKTRLIRRIESGSESLYDLEDDPTESHDRIEDLDWRERRREPSALLDDWLGAQVLHGLDLRGRFPRRR